MAFLFIEESSSLLQNAGKTLKVLVLLAGVIWSVVMVRGAIMSFSSLVGFWTSITCFLSSPLYICIIINSMVLLIAASSTFHRHETEHHHPPPPPPPEKSSLYNLHYSTPQDSVPSPDDIKKTADLMEVSDNELDERENEGNETMEATWKAITKQLQKSETFNEASTSSWKDLRKSETFNESVSIRRVGGLMREPSIGIDEFNHQVEAFIKKFNANMRLQRQESDQRFLDMIKRGL